MGRFDRQVATAQRLIKKNGQLVQWKAIRNGAPVDSSQPWKPTQSDDPPVTQGVYIAFFPIDKDTQRTYQALPGAEQPIKNEYGLMGAVDFEPNWKDVVIRNGVEYRIDKFDTLAPNGQNILYTIFFKA